MAVNSHEKMDEQLSLCVLSKLRKSVRSVIHSERFFSQDARPTTNMRILCIFGVVMLVLLKTIDIKNTIANNDRKRCMYVFS